MSLPGLELELEPSGAVWFVALLSFVRRPDGREKVAGFGWAVSHREAFRACAKDTSSPSFHLLPSSRFIIGQQDISSHVSQHDALTTCTFVHSALICWNPAPTNAAVPSIVPKTVVLAVGVGPSATVFRGRSRRHTQASFCTF